MKGTTHIRA